MFIKVWLVLHNSDGLLLEVLPVSIKGILILLLLVGGGYFYLTFTSEPAGVLVSDIALTRGNKGGQLDVSFTIPVRYLGHNPQDEGDMLQIKLRPILFSGIKENISILDTLSVAGKAVDYGIEDIRYEGNVPGAPLIIIHFSTPVQFAIKEGDGLRSLLISYQQLQRK